MIDNKKFEILLTDNTPILNKICRLYSNSEEDFNDYYQEVTIQLWQSFQSFRGDAQISTWVYRVAINTCLSLLRKDKRRVATNELSHRDQIPEGDEQAAHNERLQMLYSAIKKLKEVDRAIILLHLEDKSYKEIAEIMGITLSNVGVRINRIKTQLKQLING
ncbi:MAG: sigma-70 family RNA polymerase sigma factor [Bacteroidota bacterium]